MTDPRPLIQAIQDGDVALARDLIASDERRARGTTEDGMPLVLFAAYQGNREITDLIARHAGNLDLHSAIALGQTDTVRTILAADPDRIHQPGTDGYLPLHLAAHFGGTDMVLFLLEYGADLTLRSQNSLESTPLHSAVAAEQSEIVRLLLEKQADPLARQASGVTPLHLAALRGSRELVELLLKFGADPGAKNEAGQTALDLAREATDAGAAERLEQAAQRAPR